MFKVGDKVRIRKQYVDKEWYKTNSYIIINILDNIIYLDKFSGFVSKPHGNAIFDVCLELDIKNIRQQKLKKLCLNQETE